MGAPPSSAMDLSIMVGKEQLQSKIMISERKREPKIVSNKVT